MHAELIDLAEELGNDGLAGIAVPMLEHLLQGVVPIRILGQLVCIWHDLFKQLVSMLLRFSLLNEYFYNCETHIIHGKLQKLVLNLIEHVLPLVFTEALEQVLDHVSTLRVLQRAG